MLKASCLMFILLYQPAAVFLSQSSASEGLNRISGDKVTVMFEPGLDAAARRLVSDYPEIKTLIEARFGWSIEFRPIVKLYRHASFVANSSRRALYYAFAVPGNDLIEIDYSRVDRTPLDMRDVMEHELTHLMIHRFIESSLIPKWLDEGVAQWAGGGMADFIGTSDREILKRAVLADRILPLSTLEKNFPFAPAGEHLAYEESRSFIEFIEHERGKDSLIRILNGLRRGKSLQRAFGDEIPSGLGPLEQRWRKDLRKKYSRLSYLADHIYPSLFFFAAVITLIGFFILRRRMINYRDEDEENGPGNTHSL